MKKLACILTAFTVIFLSACSQKTVTENADVTTKQSYNTFTGRKPLKKITLKASDPENTQCIPTDEINHSFGVAENEKPHQISIDNQKLFDTKGYNAIAYNNKTSEKLLYLTFDCGWENGYTSVVLDVLKEHDVKAVFFCTLDQIKSEPELIARMINEGHTVGNHSASHANFSKISRQQMADEIAECDNELRENFGYTSKLFRFPEGTYSECALDLVGDLGYKSVFWSLSYADWDVNDQKGKNYAYEKVTSRLHPGAIILLHSVSKDNAEALPDIITHAKSQGYIFRLMK